MRIVSGKFKGKKLDYPIDKNIRPLKDMTKESIFNLLLHSKSMQFGFDELEVLDLFSGSGSFGIECISRNVKSVTFVENYTPALKVLEKNIQSLKLKNKHKIIEDNIFNLNNHSDINKNYDLIFADPPYKEERIDELLSIIFEMNYLKKKGLLILHRNKAGKEISHSKFNIVDTRIYGISKIIFLKLK